MVVDGDALVSNDLALSFSLAVRVVYTCHTIDV